MRKDPLVVEAYLGKQEAERQRQAAAGLLKIDDIHTYYGNIEALKGVSLTVEEGESSR